MKNSLFFLLQKHVIKLNHIGNSLFMVALFHKMHQINMKHTYTDMRCIIGNVDIHVVKLCRK